MAWALALADLTGSVRVHDKLQSRRPIFPTLTDPEYMLFWATLVSSTLKWQKCMFHVLLPLSMINNLDLGRGGRGEGGETEAGMWGGKGRTIDWHMCVFFAGGGC